MDPEPEVKMMRFVLELNECDAGKLADVLRDIAATLLHMIREGGNTELPLWVRQEVETTSYHMGYNFMRQTILD